MSFNTAIEKGDTRGCHGNKQQNSYYLSFSRMLFGLVLINSQLFGNYLLLISVNMHNQL